jgi:type II secretory pathway component GspD/PulD (secretin)
MGFARQSRIFASLVITTTLVVSVAYAARDIDDSPSELALSLVRKARRAARSGDYAESYMLYSQAVALQPENRKYRAAMEGMQTRAARQSPPVLPAGSAPLDIPPILPDPFDSITEREQAQAREMLPPPRLKAKAGLQDFDLNAPSRAVFTEIAHRFELEPVFDGDLPQSSTPVRFQLKQVDYREALEAAGAATNTFITPVSSRVFIVAPDTPAKRNDLEQSIAVAIPVPQAVTAQELTELVQVIRQATNVEKIASNTSRNEIIIRDRISRALPAEALLRQFLSYRPDVMLELQFISVSSSVVRAYGFNFQTNYQLYYLGNFLNDINRIPAGVTQLFTFGGGATLFGLAVTGVTALFTDSQSYVQSLYHAQLRAASGLPATLHIGDRYPVLTSGYFGATGSAAAGVNTFAPAPSFTYENLGLDMKITPHIHGTDDVSLTLETSFELLTGQAVNGIPIFGNRKVQSDVRLRDGEWVVVAGLMGDVNSRNSSGLAGLGRIPGFGSAFRTTNTDREKNAILIGVRPHLLSLPPSEKESLELRVGSETRPFIPK